MVNFHRDVMIMNKLYLISRPNTNKTMRDYYDSVVVCADSEEQAKLIHPRCINKIIIWICPDWVDVRDECDINYMWVDPGDVIVKYLGCADESLGLNTVICASYHGG